MVWELLNLQNKLLMLDYGISKTTFETPNHDFAPL
jgi:hypothetical protein